MAGGVDGAQNFAHAPHLGQKHTVRRLIGCGHRFQIGAAMIGGQGIDAQKPLRSPFRPGKQGDGLMPRGLLGVTGDGVFQIHADHIGAALHGLWKAVGSGRRDIEKAAARA